MKLPTKLLFLLFYVLTILLLGALLIEQDRLGQPSFLLSGAAAETGVSPNSLSLHGRNFHPELQGLLVKSLVNAKAQRWHLWNGTITRAFDANGDLALASCFGDKLVSLRLRDGGPPELLDSIDMPDAITQVKIIGEMALVGLQTHSGAVLVDLRTPDDMKIVKHFEFAGLITSMAVHGSTIYLANLHSGIDRIELAGGGAIRQSLTTVASPWRLAVHGSKLAVGTLKGQVSLYDILDDGQLVEVAEINSPKNVRGVAMNEKTLTVARADGRLRFYDLARWPVLGEGAELLLPGPPFQADQVPGKDEVIVSLVAGGLMLVDLRQPDAPRLMGQYRVPRTYYSVKVLPGEIIAGSAAGLQGLALDEMVAEGFPQFVTDALTAPGSYTLREWHGHVYGSRDQALIDFGRKDSPGGASSDRYLAVVDEGVVDIFARTEDAQVARVASLQIAGRATGAVFTGNLLHVVNSWGVQIFSMDSTAQPVALGRMALPGLSGLVTPLVSGHLLLTSRDSELLVLDIHDPQHPEQIARLSPREHQVMSLTIRDLVADGPRVYVSCGGAGVQIFDLSNPSKPRLQQVVDTPGSAKSMTLYDGLLLVDDGPSGVFMIDVRDRERALPIGYWEMPMRAEQLAATTDGLVISDEHGGTMKVPLPRRLERIHLVSREELRAVVEKAEKGQRVYLYDDRDAGDVEIVVR